MTKPRSKPFAPEVRERAVRLVLEHQGEYETQWAAIRSIAGEIGCSAAALRELVAREPSPRAGAPSSRTPRSRSRAVAVGATVAG